MTHRCYGFDYFPPIKKKTGLGRIAAKLDNRSVSQFPNVSGVNKKPKKFKTVWHGVRGILKLSGRVNQARLKLSAGFSNTVC